MGRALSALYDSLDFVRPEQIVEALDEIDLDGVISDSDVVVEWLTRLAAARR
jgi:hypothetical protein